MRYIQIKFNEVELHNINVMFELIAQLEHWHENSPIGKIRNSARIARRYFTEALGHPGSFNKRPERYENPVPTTKQKFSQKIKNLIKDVIANTPGTAYNNISRLQEIDRLLDEKNVSIRYSFAEKQINDIKSLLDCLRNSFVSNATVDKVNNILELIGKGERYESPNV